MILYKHFLPLFLFLFIGFLADSQIQFGNQDSINGLHIDYQKPMEYEIGPITVIGADNFDPQAIKLISGLRQGDKIKVPGDKITRAIKNLWAEKLFSNVEIYATKEIEGVLYLTIEVKPLPKLSRFKFSGVTRHDVDKIREEIGLFSGQTITDNLVYTTNAKIRGYFREKGYYHTTVNIQRVTDTLMNNSEIFLIDIDKGERIIIKEIKINGNVTLADAKLKRSMKDTKEFKLWRFFKRSKFTESSYEKDKLALLSKYNSVGMRDAHITEDTIYFISPKKMVIDITVEEGSKYYFGNIEWIGNTKFRSSYLDTVLGIKKGDIYNKSLLEERLFMSQDGRDISSLYMDRGYLFFQIIPVESNVDDNYINYQMRIMEGKEARVGSVTIKGNTKTNDAVIRREIRTKPGDLFNRNDIIRTQRELAQLGYFNEQAFQVNPIPNPTDGTVDIEYVVEEKSSDQIELSGGYSGATSYSYGGIVGTLGLTFNNFSTKKMFRKGAWTPLPGGDGQRLSIRAQSSGRYYQGYNFSFTEPWLGGKKPNSLTYWVNHTNISSAYEKTSSSYYHIGISGMGIGLGRRKKIPDDYFTAYYELSYQYYDINNYSSFAAFKTGYANDIAFKYILQRNSISAPIYPQSGSNILFSAKSTLPYSLIANKDYGSMTAQERYKYLEYYKFKFTGEWYFPLTKDKKLILMPRFGFGFVGAYNYNRGLTPFDLFTLGGSGITGTTQIGGREIIALRGYEDQSISSYSGDPLIAKYTLELRYPISLNPSATFFMLAFAEAGNTFPSFRQFNPFNVKRAVGMGIRIYLPMFGMLGIDYGFGFDKLDTWSTDYGSGTSDTNISNKGYTTKITFTIGMNLGEL